MATVEAKSTITPSRTGNLNFCTPKKSSRSDSVSMVRVIVRVRPFLPHEISATNGAYFDKPTPCVSLLDSPLESSNEVTVHLKDPETSRNESYKLDSFYGQEDNNVRQIYEREVMPLIPAILHGCNATVFAYGATGSGKTFTMQGNEELPGLMPMAMSTILSMCKNTRSTVEMSYYEVYMERCYDLLEVKTKEIAILNDEDGQIHLKTLAKIPVNSMLEFQEAFSRGVHRRKVAHTGLNDVSSRSHGVLVISVSRPCKDGSGNAVTGKLNLIDLAGNEDNRRTGNEGVRLLESTKINRSLFALSNVIYALNNKYTRVPYRESKLTRILQDSLGGTSHALMVACLNPGEYEQSVHTVSLAARSRRISNCVESAQKHNTPKTQVDMEAKLRAWLESKGKTNTSQKSESFRSPYVSRTPSSISSIKKLNTCQSSVKSKKADNQGVAKLKERSALLCRKNLSYNEKDEAADKDKTKDKIQAFGDEILLEATSTSEKATEKTENAVTPMKKEDPLGSLRTSERIKELKGSLRKVLSPINSNMNVENMSFRDQICGILFDPTTPKSSVVDNKMMNTDTPLSKFKAMSSNLKITLAREYIDFLNTASKEELMQLKGIGEKTAESIIELRDTSPLKSLNDLEKINLSSKQVHNMFGRTAKELFN